MRYEWLKAFVLTGGIMAAWLAFFHVTLRADAIQPLGSSSASGGSVQALGRDGIQINGTANTTVSSPFTFDLGSTLTFDTITSNPGQPITFNSATGTVIITAGQALTADTLTPTTANTTLSLSGTGTGGVNIAGLVNVNQEIASSVIVTDLTAKNATFNGSVIFTTTSSVVGVGSVLLSSATIVTLSTTDVTATRLWTNQIGPRTSGAILVNATAGLSLGLDDGTQATTFVPAANQMTITPPGGASGVLQLGNGIVGTFIAGNIDAITSFICTGNATVSGFLFNTQRRPYTGTSLRNEASTHSFEDMSGANASTFTPAANILTIDVNGATGALVLASGDTFSVDTVNVTTNLVSPAATITTLTATTGAITTLTGTTATETDLNVNTIHARTGTTVTIDSADDLLVNAIKGNPAGIELKATSGILMELNAGTFPSTWTPASAQLTLNVNGAGTFILDSTDTLRLAALTSNGGPLYADSSGNVKQSTAGTSTQLYHGGTTPAFSQLVDADITANTITAGSLAASGTNRLMLTPATVGRIEVDGGTGNPPVALAQGAAGTVLISQGAAANPAFTAFSGDITISSGGVTTIGAGRVTDAMHAANTLTTGSMASSVTNRLMVTPATVGRISVDGGSGAASVALAQGSAGDFLVSQGAAANPLFKTMSGDATLSSGGALTLSNSGATAGTYGDASNVAQVTVDAKGRVTAASNVAITGVNNTTLYTNTADVGTVANKTVLTSFGTIYTIPANTFIAGDILEIFANGTVGAGANASQSINANIKVGSTSLRSYGAPTFANATTQTNRGWQITYDGWIRTGGASGNAEGFGGLCAGFPDQTTGAQNDFGTFFFTPPTLVSSIDWTSAQVLTIEWKFGVDTVGTETATLTNIFIKRMRP